MQSNSSSRQGHGSSPTSEEGGLLEALLTTAPSVLNRYQRKLTEIQNTLRWEAKLNLKCGLLILGFSIVALCVLFSSWLGINALVVFGLLSLDATLPMIVLAVMCLHLLALLSLYKAIGIVSSQIGFQHFLAAIGLSSNFPEDESP